MSSAICFNLDQSKTCRLVMGKLFTKRQILEYSKLKAFATNVTENRKFVFRRVENIVGKGENAGYQRFLLFPGSFQKASYTGSLKVMVV